VANKRQGKREGAQADPISSAKKPFLLRIPPDLMEELRGWANQELRSLNGHMEYLLREAVRRRKGRGDSDQK
jgi:hypothetical protein